MIVIEFIFILAIRGRYFNFHDTPGSFREKKSLGSGGSMINSFLTMIRKNDHCFLITKKA